MKTTNQSNKAYKLNYSQNLDDIYFIFMVTIQPKLIANIRVMKVIKESL